jgi:hypothetical protein
MARQAVFEHVEFLVQQKTIAQRFGLQNTKGSVK